MDPITLSIAGSAASGLAQTMGNIWTNKQNIAAQEKFNARQWELQDYWRQQDRQWALDDWNRTNAYNSPLQQMQRLREAGLNPNLVYGKGADNTATMVRSASGMSPGGQAPHRQAIPIPDIGNMISDAVTLSNQNKQAALMRETLQNDIILKNKKASMMDLDMLGKDILNKTNAFNLQFKQELKDSLLERAKLNNELLRQQTAKTVTEIGLMPKRYELDKLKYQLDKVRTTEQLKNVVKDGIIKQMIITGIMPEKIKQAQLFTKSKEFENAVKQLEATMAKQGIAKGSAAYTAAGVVQQFINDILSNFNQ